MPERRTLHLLGPSTGGIRRHVGTLAASLPAHGWDVEVAGPAGVMEGVGRQDHVVPVAVDPRAVVAGRAALDRLVVDADLVHAHGLKAGWLASTLRRRPPLVVTVHNLVLDEVAGRAAPLLRVLEAGLPARADRVIAVSTEIARRFTGAAGAGRIVVVAPAGPAPRPRRSPSEVRAALGVGPHQPLVVTVARLHPQKDLPTLLHAAVALRSRVPDAVVAVVGEGPQRAELEALARHLGVEGTVRLPGASANAADEMAAADVVASSSRWEGSPLVVAEALQLGRPVAATSVGAVPEVVVDGRTGRLVPPGDAGALAAAVADLLEQPDVAARLAAAGREVAAARFATGRLVGEVAAVYDDVAGRR